MDDANADGWGAGGQEDNGGGVDWDAPGPTRLYALYGDYGFPDDAMQTVYAAWEERLAQLTGPCEPRFERGSGWVPDSFRFEIKYMPEDEAVVWESMKRVITLVWFFGARRVMLHRSIPWDVSEYYSVDDWLDP